MVYRSIMNDGGAKMANRPQQWTMRIHLYRRTKGGRRSLRVVVGSMGLQGTTLTAEDKAVALLNLHYIHVKE
jgi:hypothetical protein